MTRTSPARCVGIASMMSLMASVTAVAAMSTVSPAAGSAATRIPGATGAVAGAPAGRGEVAIVQAVPDRTLSVSVDGEQVDAGAEVGDVVGPLDLTAGEHQVTFAGDGYEKTSKVDVAGGAAMDVVVHEPATVDGDPVVSVFTTPDAPVAPGEARVLLAHTATTAPADVDVDGTVVFVNIANGEFAQADVAAGSHVVSLLPAGVGGDPILGPLDVTLEAGTITAVYAVGDPRVRSMDVVVRVSDAATGATATPPAEIDTGEAGLLGGQRVWTFSTS